MPLIKLNAAAVRIGIKRALLDTIIKNGKELNGQKVGARYFVDEAELDAWHADEPVELHAISPSTTIISFAL